MTSSYQLPVALLNTHPPFSQIIFYAKCGAVLSRAANESCNRLRIKEDRGVGMLLMIFGALLNSSGSAIASTNKVSSRKRNMPCGYKGASERQRELVKLVNVPSETCDQNPTSMLRKNSPPPYRVGERRNAKQKSFGVTGKKSHDGANSAEGKYPDKSMILCLRESGSNTSN